MSATLINRPGHDALWLWFGLGRPTFLTMARVLMHEMPDEWQGRMAELLEEWDETWTNWPAGQGTTVRLTRDGKLIATPGWLLNYRHPDKARIAELRSGGAA